MDALGGPGYGRAVRLDTAAFAARLARAAALPGVDQLSRPWNDGAMQSSKQATCLRLP